MNKSNEGGIQGFSKPSDELVIFSSRIAYPNIVTDLLKNSGKFYMCLAGAYNGKPETSWVVKKDDFYNHFANLADGEESILLLGKISNSLSQRRAVLVFLDEKSPDIDLGYWQQVDRETALRQAGYSIAFMHGDYVKITPHYFICCHNDKFGNPILD